MSGVVRHDQAAAPLAGLSANPPPLLILLLCPLPRPRVPAPPKVVPLKEYLQEEVGAHNGADPARPMLLSIKGVVYDITAGKAFYGPDGGCRAHWHPRMPAPPPPPGAPDCRADARCLVPAPPGRCRRVPFRWP